MAMSGWSVGIGSALGVVVLVALTINLLVLFAIIRGRMLRSQGSPIYIISTSNLVGDTLQLLLHLGYLIPSIISQSWLFPGGKADNRTLLVSSTFMFFWYHSSLTQILMALNRLIVVCVPSSQLFTRGRVLFFALAVFPVAFGLCLLSQYILPCCAFYFDYTVFSYSYNEKPGDINYPNIFIDLPLNSLSSLICLLSYTTIIIYVHRARLSVSTAVSSRHREKKRGKEYSYALQFCCISIFYLVTWVLFRVFPVVLGANELRLYALVALTMIINCCANGLIYLISNKEVQKSLAGSFSVHSLLNSHEAVVDKVVNPNNRDGSGGSRTHETVAHVH